MSLQVVQSKMEKKIVQITRQDYTIIRQCQKDNTNKKWLIGSTRNYRDMQDM